MSVENSAGVGHPICLAFLDAVTQAADQSYQLNPRALPGLQNQLRALCDDQAGLLDAIFSLLDLARFLRSERSPKAAADVVHLVVSCCSDTLKQMGAAGGEILTAFEPEQPADAQKMHNLLGLERDRIKPTAEPAPGSIPGPLARLATASSSSSQRRHKKR